MNKSTSNLGTIVFQCRCQLTEMGHNDDTLMKEVWLEADGGDHKHEIFIENSAFDPAANIVKKTCPDCGLDFLTMIRIGITETTMYTCSCGFKAVHTDYIKKLAK